jgi:hypothetical protein
VATAGAVVALAAGLPAAVVPVVVVPAVVVAAVSGVGVVAWEAVVGAVGVVGAVADVGALVGVGTGVEVAELPPQPTSRSATTRMNHRRMYPPVHVVSDSSRRTAPAFTLTPTVR